MTNTYPITLLPQNITVPCSSSQTILSALEQNKLVPKLIGCRRGGCGICKVQIIEGSVETGLMSSSHIRTDDRKNGVLLACRIKPTGPVKLEIIGI